MNPFLDPTRSCSTEVSETPKSEGVPSSSPKTDAPEAAKPRRKRGFAAMDRSRVSEIASKGGKAAHAAGTAHQFSTEEARAAGHKGGVAPHVRRGRGPRAQANSSPAPSVSEEQPKA